MIFTVFKKELRDTLRDRRTIMMMIVIPTLVFPIIMSVFMSISDSFQKEAAEKKVKIGLISNQVGSLEADLLKVPSVLGKKEFIPFTDTISLIKAIRSDSVQVGIYVPNNAEELKKEMKPISVTVFHDGTDLGMKDRAETYLSYVQENWKKQRYAQLKIDEAKITPFVVAYSNVASSKEMIGKLAGGFLPYLFIAFGFMGCMFPAIDLFTGEKERSTIETLLTTPVPRWKILFGKMGVVVLSGLLAATFNLLGIYLAIEVLDLVKDPVVLKAIKDILSPTFIIMLYALLVPLIVFFAGIMIPIAVRAKSFKEAQSIISPLNILIILPAMVGFFPGVELNEVTALIPVVNIVLATKELIAGTLEFHLIAMAFGVMVLLAAIAVMLSYRKFENENNVIS
ncbi:ABC transporter permease [Fluviicola taffensis]|uniref:ABC-type Na+ efflux pump, permease component n=1 Tax=Fluviicola taffensis (strain DSM 16823 / NCIMB 13979 / RW262) TaxID=755732 RepID=F2IF99_FLUTR|nr:ABC transporter permease [Fluviicola taffensis]AEA44584.1 ABC-type Na+ efflux pump, permease component [Fluviicola taffensis DSM 16823]